MNKYARLRRALREYSPIDELDAIDALNESVSLCLRIQAESINEEFLPWDVAKQMLSGAEAWHGQVCLREAKIDVDRLMRWYFGEEQE